MANARNAPGLARMTMPNDAENSPLLKSAEQPVVLVAEDDEQISFLLQVLLEREGFRVALARDGREAQRLIDGMLPPALALLDIMMPHLDGFELLARIRSNIGWRAVPVMVLTARSREQDIARAQQAGATDYIVKPFLPEELKARIRRLVHPDDSEN